jgi:high frequency lysogenization protein
LNQQQEMTSNTRNQSIALAALFQAIRLVQQTARGQHRDEVDFNACMTGLFNTSPESPESVFGELAGLRTGLEMARNQLGDSKADRDMELTRYAITVLYLERKLNRSKPLLDSIRNGIEKARGQADFLGTTHKNVIASLADCYQQTISTLRPRIIVNGEQPILGNPDNQNLIRTLLLAAIRAAVLWRQCGGGRLTLILRRKALLESIERLLQETRVLH